MTETLHKELTKHDNWQTQTATNMTEKWPNIYFRISRFGCRELKILLSKGPHTSSNSNTETARFEIEDFTEPRYKEVKQVMLEVNMTYQKYKKKLC